MGKRYRFPNEEKLLKQQIPVGYVLSRKDC